MITLSSVIYFCAFIYREDGVGAPVITIKLQIGRATSTIRVRPYTVAVCDFSTHPTVSGENDKKSRPTEHGN